MGSISTLLQLGFIANFSLGLYCGPIKAKVYCWRTKNGTTSFIYIPSILKKWTVDHFLGRYMNLYNFISCIRGD